MRSFCPLSTVHCSLSTYFCAGKNFRNYSFSAKCALYFHAVAVGREAELYGIFADKIVLYVVIAL